MEFIDEPKEMNVSLNLNVSQLQSKVTYFFKRLKDDEVIPIEDPQVAWDYYRRRQQDFKYVGQSDAKAFMQGIREARAIFKEKGLEASQERIHQAIIDEIKIAETNTNPPVNADVQGTAAHLVRDNIIKYG